MIDRNLRRLVSAALDEDLGSGDITTAAVVPLGATGAGGFVSREPLVLCGVEVVEAVYAELDPTVSVTRVEAEGAELREGAVVARVAGPLGSVLTGERLALNFLQRLCGVATETRRYVTAMGPTLARLVDTRKTTPGLRALEKRAVRVGGGHNHRFGLDDGVMIKDNHILAAGGIAAAVQRARERSHHLVRIEVEVDTLEQAHEAVDAGARVLLLDNFSPSALAAAVQELRERSERLTLEASGRVRLDTVAEIAATGVDVISCGALIHQARWCDLALDLDG